MEQTEKESEGFQEGPSPVSYPPKPVLEERKENVLRQSIFSLLTYFVLFYLLFNQEISYIAAILVVIIIHEFGHLLAMKAFQYKDVKIFILPLVGALTTGEKQEISLRQLSIIILAGPIPGIIIGLAIYFFNKELNSSTLQMLSNSFLVLNIFNLLPIYPLDGGRLIETLFFKQNFVIRLVFGIISIMVLTVLFILSQQPFLLIVPVFMVIDLLNESKNEKIRNYLDTERIPYRSSYEELPDKNYWIIRDCILFTFSKKFNGVEPGNYHYSVFEPVLINQVKRVLQPNIINDTGIIGKIILVLVYLFFIVAPIYILASHLSITD